MRASRISGLVFLLAAAGLLAFFTALRLELIASRYNPLLTLDLTDPPGLMSEVKLWLIEGNRPACIAAFARANVVVTAMPHRTAKPGCGREGTVLVRTLSEADIGGEEMRCDVAMRLYLLERHIIQPLARRHLGAGVDRITHFGSYSCRTIRGSSWRMSEHSTANAFDISGFRTANGRMISLKKDWPTGGAPARFLRDVRRGACSLFNMVLSPDYNADHADHFHVDQGLFRGCH